MRTTVTIDPDAAALLSAFMKRQNLSFNEALNLAIRTGLSTAGKGKSPRVQLPGISMRLRPGINLDKALALAGELEDEELVRRIQSLPAHAGETGEGERTSGRDPTEQCPGASALSPRMPPDSTLR